MLYASYPWDKSRSSRASGIRDSTGAIKKVFRPIIEISSIISYYNPVLLNVNFFFYKMAAIYQKKVYFVSFSLYCFVLCGGDCTSQNAAPQLFPGN